MGCCPCSTVIENGSPVVADRASLEAPIWYLPRDPALAPPPVVVALDAWGTSAPQLQRVHMPQRRVPGDNVDVLVPLTWATWGPGSCVEWQGVGDPWPAGVDTSAAVAWLIGRAATLTGVVRPWLSLRMFDISGTVLRATLLPLGEYGNGTNMNANGTRLWAGAVAGGAPLAAYVTQDGDRPVLELGWNTTSNPAEASSQYGSYALVAGNTHAMHVMSTAAEGVNPGSRIPYLELDGLVLP